MEGNITQYADWVTLVTCDQWGQWSVVTTRYHHHLTLANRAGNKPSRSYTVTEKAPTILRHYAKQGLTKVNQCTVGQISQFCPMGVLGLFIL